MELHPSQNAPLKKRRLTKSVPPKPALLNCWSHGSTVSAHSQYAPAAKAPKVKVQTQDGTFQPRALSSRAGMASLSSVKAAVSTVDSRSSAWSKMRHVAHSPR